MQSVKNVKVYEKLHCHLYKGWKSVSIMKILFSLKMPPFNWNRSSTYLTLYEWCVWVCVLCCGVYFSLNIFLSLLNFDHMSLACFLLLAVSFRYSSLLRISEMIVFDFKNRICLQRVIFYSWGETRWSPLVLQPLSCTNLDRWKTILYSIVGITNDETKPRHLVIILSHCHLDFGIETNLCGEELAANVLSYNMRHVYITCRPIGKFFMLSVTTLPSTLILYLLAVLVWQW
jgi:hypothetical protein